MADRSSAHTVSDPLSGRELIFAPGRARRPGGYRRAEPPLDTGEAESCPFCEGREAETPPELFALGGPADRRPDEPGWKVRVVPNLYPAFERQQVVVHSADHAHSLTDLSDQQIALVAEAWAEIADRAWKEGFDHLFAFVNEGGEAGASRAHSHSQAVWLKGAPPELALEAPRLRKESCALCALLREIPPSLKLAKRTTERGVVQLAVSPFGRSPYELLIAPSEHAADAYGEVDQLAAALALAAGGVRMLHAVEGPASFNLWLHSFQGDGHWHLELVPRLTELAGIELGMGVFINTLEPEEAAARLRGAPS